MKTHGTFPSTVLEAEKELKDHKEFLASLQPSITELQTMANSLKCHSTYSVKRKVLYLVGRIDVRVKERVSIIEKRVHALKMLQDLYIMNEQV